MEIYGARLEQPTRPQVCSLRLPWGQNLACMLICTISAQWPRVNVMKEACQSLSPAQGHGCVCEAETLCHKEKG